ncbi:MAG: glycoside hydrolase family 88 protein [Candidatus Saccharicenans sp.]|nr:glycoside hydrolase family 88 protein [Candidatus Saccharicenans sp.]MDI6848518.1 glycoside hydrolase family 88 protein [Candidatus Saccharicenans sp.]
MKRRNFLSTAAMVGMLGGRLVGAPGWNTRAATEAGNEKELIDRVITAMLTMQRQAWEQGVAAQALLELGEEKLVIMMAREAVLRQWDDGRLGQVCDNHGVTDPGANGEAVLYAGKVLSDERLLQAARKQAEYFLKVAPRTDDGVIFHIDNKPQLWIDSMYMCPPFLAVMGYYQEAIFQVEGLRKYLWNPKKKLFSHIFDYGLRKLERQDFWGVGNGWAAAGLTRVLRALPENLRKEKRSLQGYLKDLLEGCLKHQRKDGLFHDVLDKPETFVETNLAQMLAYTIYRNIQLGWLDQGYLKKAEEMRQAVHKKVDSLGYVNEVCGSPLFQSAGVATEGQAFFLLMEAARRDLLGQGRPQA